MGEGWRERPLSQQGRCRGGRGLKLLPCCTWSGSVPGIRWRWNKAC